jgi:polar amino acid transport system substrate-binding protein
VRPNSPEILKDLAPTGRLRAAINLGNPVLAQKAADGAPKGVTVDLARELAQRIGLPLDLVAFDAAGKVFDALKSGALDLAFIAIEPVRAAELEFTAPYVIIEGTYMVPLASSLREIADFDRPGIRIAVGRGSAYHLYLERTIRRATLVPAPTGGEAIATFVADKLEAAANVRQPLADYAAKNPGYRVIGSRFMEIRQAMAVPKGRLAAAGYLGAFIEEQKASGFVADALAKSGQDAAVAPPA